MSCAYVAIKSATRSSRENVGIDLDRGWLKDLDTPIFSFFPEYADLRTPENDSITLRHLLGRCSGLDRPERAISINNPANIVR